MIRSGKPMSRWKAAGIHVLFSIALALTAGALMFGVWFPPPYFHATGGDRLVFLLICVDLVVGPLLTLIVFKSGKWGMKFDLFCIGAVQVAAMVYGLSVITTSRPAFIVATISRFSVVPANAVDDEVAQATRPEYRRLPWFGPRMVSAQVPADAKAREEIMAMAMEGVDIDRMPQYYAPLEAISEKLKKEAKPLAHLIEQRPAQNQPVVDAALRKLRRSAERIGYMPLVAARGELVMLIDLDTGLPLLPVELESAD